jgi:Fe-S cluster assembly scaffold protein SufB
MTQSMVGSFDEELVKRLSNSLEEPAWLTQERLEAYKRYSSLPQETNPLYTKYVSTFGIGLDGFNLSAERERLDLRTFFKDFLTGKETNVLLQGNTTPIHTDLDPDLAALGVTFMPIHEALKAKEDLVKAAFDRRTGSENDKYKAFTGAFFNGGTFIHVPRGVALAKPLRRMLLLDSPRFGVVELLLLLAEEESKVVFLEELYSRKSQSPSLLASDTEIYAGPGSNVDFSSIQLLDDLALQVSNREIRVLNDSRATVSALSLGASASRSRMNFHLDGRGSLAEGFEIFFTDGKQRYDFETNLVHNSPDSTGSTQARGVLKGESQSIFKGMIKIVNAAKNSRSYLAHHAMLLERTAKSDAVPSLEIENNEVRATHSASVAQVDEEQLFYLNARGLAADEAKKVVVLGFFEPVLSRVPIEKTREGARFMIEGKWQGEKRRLVDRETLLEATGELTPEVKQTEDIFERHYKYR